jgi:pimeloyl-ACP methyl ester carboxylesterase
MLNVKTLIKQFYPKAHYLVARSNEGQTDGDVFKMGERLAKEIERYIRDEEIDKDLQINMVGHSMGGLILRAALQHLEGYKNCLGTFMTFGSPHLGYLQGIKTMIKTGLWFIKSWNKTYSLEQLTMTDHKNLLETAVYRLSKLGSLKNFRNVVLLSSY